MRKVIIGFSRPHKTKIVSSLIMAAECTDYSHVYVRFSSPTFNRCLIYQASGVTVNFVGLLNFVKHNHIVEEFVFEVSDRAYVELMQFCIDNAGAPYGVKQLIGMAIRKIGKWTGLNWKNPWADGKQTYVCSELAAYIIRDYIYGSIGTNLDDMDPKDIYDCVSMLRDSLDPKS